MPINKRESMVFTIIMCAIIGDWFLVAPTAKKIAIKAVGHDAPVWKKMIAIPTCMVCGMVLIMSLFGAIMGVGFSSQTISVWVYNIPANFIVALPMQLIVAGPAVRFVFRKAFPEGVITK